jgi:hypothetical protein
MNKDQLTEILKTCAEKTSLTLSAKNINDIIKSCLAGDKLNSNATNKALLTSTIGEKKIQKSPEFLDMFISMIKDHTNESNKNEIESISTQVNNYIKDLDDITTGVTNNTITNNETNIQEYLDMLQKKDRIIQCKDEIINIKETSLLDKDKLYTDVLKEKEDHIKTLYDTIREREKTIECHLEVIQKLIRSHENIVAHDFQPGPGPASSSGPQMAAASRQPTSVRDSEAKPATDITLSIENHNETFAKILGKTYGYKDVIKQASGAAWSSDHKVWTVPLTSVDELVALFEASKIKYNNNVTDAVPSSESTSEIVISDNNDLFRSE